MKINEGLVNLQVTGVVNLEEIKSNLSSNLEKYKNVIWTEETRKDIKTLVSELKPERVKIKKIAAAFNKAGKEIVRTKYDEIKSIEHLLDEVINPLEQREKDFLEKIRLNNIEKKKAIFQEQIKEINEIIIDQNRYFNYVLHEKIGFLDDWGKKSEKAIKLELEKIVDDLEKRRTEIINLKDGVMTAAELFKSQYGLKSSLNYELILGDRIFTETLQDCKTVLEKFAVDQQAKEIEAEEIAKERAERKAKKEADRIAAEQRKKDQEAEKKRKAEIAEAEEKVRLEEKAKQDKIEAERAEKERLEIEAAEKERIEKEKIGKERLEAEKKEQAKQNKSNSVNTRDYTVKFTVNKEQAKVLFQCLIDNDIKYEKLDA